jgi:1-acyl-sn-glycerol-3-phosphate acyltransferase
MILGGLAMGKAAEKAGVGKKSVDSSSFRTGLKSWMMSNGIFPEVELVEVNPEREEAELRNIYPSLPVGPINQMDDMQNVWSTPIIVSNHVCYMDGIVLAASFGAPKIVAMEETRSYPIVGKIMQEMDVVFVDRKSETSRQETKEAIKEHCRSWEPGQRPLLIFPEGMTGTGQGMRSFKTGAFVPGVPVRPVLLMYTGQWDPASVTFRETPEGKTEELTEAEWAKQFFGHFLHTLTVRVLPPFIPSAEERENPELFAQGVHDYMEAELQRLRTDVESNSWKKFAGREDGGLGFKFGDLGRGALRIVKEKMKERGVSDAWNNVDCCRHTRHQPSFSEVDTPPVKSIPPQRMFRGSRSFGT